MKKSRQTWKIGLIRLAAIGGLILTVGIDTSSRCCSGCPCRTEWTICQPHG